MIPRSAAIGVTVSIQDEINKQLSASRKAGERDREKLQTKLAEVSRKQDVIAGQITERIMNGHPQIEAFNKMLDDLQK